MLVVTAERNKLRRAYEMVKGELELLRRRIFVAKAERIDTTQLEIEFAETKAKLDHLACALDEGAVHGGAGAAANENAPTQGGGTGDGRPASQKTSKGSGRPDLRKLELIEERVEITDPALEGTAERIGFETTYLLGRRRACNVRVVVAKVTYKTTTTNEGGEAMVEYSSSRCTTRASRWTTTARRTQSGSSPSDGRTSSSCREEAGKELALLYSLVVSCDRLGKNPVTYLTDVLHRINRTPRDRLADLLPDRWEPTPMPPVDPISVD